MTPEALMRKVAKGFEQGDLQPLLDAVDENTIWKAGPLQSDGPLRFGGEYKMRAGVLEITSLLATLYVFQRFEPREIIACEEVVWGLFDAEGEASSDEKAHKVGHRNSLARTKCKTILWSIKVFSTPFLVTPARFFCASPSLMPTKSIFIDQTYDEPDFAWASGSHDK